MLIQFSVDNCLSFDEEQIFSMVATGGDQHPKHLVQDVPRKGEALLRGAALYGANAAGKSNMVKALYFAQSFVIQGSRGETTIPLRPFRLSVSDKNRPSKFEFIIKASGVVYNYGFRLDAKRVVEEWLYATPKTKEVKYFERKTSEDGKTEVEFGPSLKSKNNETNLFLKFFVHLLKPTQLFLSKANEEDTEQLQPIFEKFEPVFNWFNNTLLVLGAEDKPDRLEVISRDQQFANFLISLLKVAGTGIEEVETREIDFDIQKNFSDKSEAEVGEIREQIDALPKNGSIKVKGSNGKVFSLTKGEEGQPVRLILTMQHSAKDGKSVLFAMSEQSEGTQRLIHLAPALFMLKNKPEQVLVIDELDRRLHTHLSRFFVQTALECDEEHRRSQLIFTTHDTNLLDLDLLRRDEIWFVEKDKEGASHLYSLAEFKIRPDLRIEKGYLSGRFGAIPFIGNADGLLCGEDGLNAASNTSSEKLVDAVA